MTFPSGYPLPRGVSEITSTLFRLPFSARSGRRKCARARGVITFHYFVPAKPITFMRKSVPYSLPSYTDVAINKKVIVTFRIWELNKSVLFPIRFTRIRLPSNNLNSQYGPIDRLVLTVVVLPILGRKN